MTTDIPTTILDWLDEYRIPLDPDSVERGQNVWAEWDARTDTLYLGQWVQETCPRCGQTDRWEHSIIPPKGFTDNDWGHGCGHWWSPVITYTLPASKDSTGRTFDKALRDLTAQVTKRRAAIRAKVRKRLTVQLRGFLALPPDKQAEQVSDESTPGVYRDADGEIECWDFDPTGESECGITVYARDLD